MPGSSAPTFLGRLGDIRLGAESDPTVEPGHQWLLISAAEGMGLALVYTLSGLDISHLKPEHEIALDDELYFRIPHTAEVDARLKRLVDLCTDIRLNAPSLVQLQLTSVPAAL
jgi:hypothetical protein